MASTYTPIATTTLGSAAASITFNSLGSYTDIRVVVVGTTASNGQDFSIRFNGDSGSNYSWTILQGNGSSAISARGSNTTYGFLIGSSSNTTPTMATADIQSYAGSPYKTVISRGGDVGNGYVQAVVSTWRNTAAITSITILSAGGANLSTGTTATIYGIKAA